jgi:CyaY protein
LRLQAQRAFLAAPRHPSEQCNGKGRQRACGRHPYRLDRYTCLALQHDFILPAMTAPTAPDTLTDRAYHTLTAAVLGGIEAAVDAWLQDDVVDIDASRTGGLLELSFPNGSKIVINTQPPLHELWLAARSGGFHFRCVQGRWTDTKDGRDFYAALSDCASAQAGRALRFLPVA